MNFTSKGIKIMYKPIDKLQHFFLDFNQPMGLHMNPNNRWVKMADRIKGEPTPLECVEDEKSQEKILEAVRATEMHIALSCIAMGILQSFSVIYIRRMDSR